jgi:hypothetical protein
VDLDRAALLLDEQSAARVRPVLTWWLDQGAGDPPDVGVVERFLTEQLPSNWRVDEREQHEVAWALGDLFERAGLAAQAEECRSAAVHEVLAGWGWTRSLPGVAAEFWRPALATLRDRRRRSGVPPRAQLSMASARGLLEVVADGVTLTEDGQLPLPVVVELDDRFRWTQEFPWMRRTAESDVAPLRLLREHLAAQHLLAYDGPRLVPTDLGRACTRSTQRLWRAVVDPSPRWSAEFERDALAVMAASVLRSADFSLGRIGEEVTQVLAGKWRPADRASLHDGVLRVVQAWYQLGVPLGWWDTGHGAADRRPNGLGRAAAVAVFGAVAAPGVRGSVGTPG